MPPRIAISMFEAAQERKDAHIPSGDKLTVHLQNRGEAFSGMRAYHQSEISHKKDAIEILKVIIQTSVIIYGGLLVSLYNEIAGAPEIFYLSLFISGLIIWATWSIIFSTNKKISADHDKYMDYLFEYAKEREIVGLQHELRINLFDSHFDPEVVKKRRKTIDELRKKKKENNYKFILSKRKKTVVDTDNSTELVSVKSGSALTETILNKLGFTVTLIAFIGMLIIMFASMEKIKDLTDHPKQQIKTIIVK